MADEKKSLQRDDAIFIYAALIHQSTNENQNNFFFSQNPLRTRAKNIQGARKYPLRENTLHHPSLGLDLVLVVRYTSLSKMWDSQLVYIIDLATETGRA